jgi:hypothetical protein
MAEKNSGHSRNHAMSKQLILIISRAATDALILHVKTSSFNVKPYLINNITSHDPWLLGLVSRLPFSLDLCSAPGSFLRKIIADLCI